MIGCIKLHPIYFSDIMKKVTKVDIRSFHPADLLSGKSTWYTHLDGPKAGIFTNYTPFQHHTFSTQNLYK